MMSSSGTRPRQEMVPYSATEMWRAAGQSHAVTRAGLKCRAQVQRACHHNAPQPGICAHSMLFAIARERSMHCWLLRSRRMERNSLILYLGQGTYSLASTSCKQQAVQCWRAVHSQHPKGVGRDQQGPPWPISRASKELAGGAQGTCSTWQYGLYSLYQEEGCIE